jgi:hypothetical protein
MVSNWDKAAKAMLTYNQNKHTAFVAFNSIQGSPELF